MKIFEKIISFLRNIHKKKMQFRLKNKEFSLIASNCNGMFILQDLQLPYKSPFVNLWLYPKDFIKFLENIDYYLKQDLEFIKKEGINYPVGKLGDIEIYFQHYETEGEAFEKWNKRAKRIDKKNLFILMTDRDGCTQDDLLKFDNLPYKNKKVLTHVAHSEISSALYVPGWEDEDSVGMCYEYRYRYSVKRRYEVFDYVKWFNKGLK